MHDISSEALASLPNAALEEAVAELSAQIDVAEHRLLTLIREFDKRLRYRDHGLGSTAAWLGWRVGLGMVAAREKVRVAKALGGLPLIDAALAKGEVSYSKVRAMTRIANPTNEKNLLHMAKNATAAQLDRICRGVEQVTSTTEAGQERWVRAARCSDGMVRIEARLHADEAALVMAAIDVARGEAPASAEAPVPAPASAEASPAADALVRVADAFLAGQRPDGRPGGERHQILVCVREDALMPDGVAADAGIAHVPPDTLRRLACDAGLTRVTVNDEGTPLDVGRKSRTIPPAIRRALIVRDRCCRFPGCENTKWLDAHHIDHWMHGGETSRDNLVLLCTTHHRLLHEGGFTLARHGGELAFRRPDGTDVTLPPPRSPSPLQAGRVVAPRAPWSNRPNYHWAIGALVPRREVPRGHDMQAM